MKDVAPTIPAELAQEGIRQLTEARSSVMGSIAVELQAILPAAIAAATLENNRQWQAKQAQTQGVAGQSRAQVQLSGIQRQSAASAGIQIAGAVVGGYANNQKVVAADQAANKARP